MEKKEGKKERKEKRLSAGELAVLFETGYA